MIVDHIYNVEMHDYCLYHCSTAPRVRHIEDLSELEQRLFYTRVLGANFNFLYQHLNTPAILATLGERGLIEPDAVDVIQKYSERHAQNPLAIFLMQEITAPPNCMEKLCEVLNQDHIARKLFSGKIMYEHKVT